VRVTTKGRYALRAIVDLALAEQDKPVPIKDIAKREGISPEFLEQIFFKLKKSGIIRSVRGPGGGFSMNQDLSEITMKDIFEAVGEEVALAPCQQANGTEPACEREKECIMKDLWSSMTEHIVQYLSGLNLKTIVEMNRKTKVS
jgi:Rrf2 family iron-sulfur cluster assembly transcriptional regulator